MSGLSKGDLSVIEGDARVSDRRLMEVLEYSRIQKVHDLIKRHFEELEDLGEVFTRVGKNPSPKGGRPIITHYLNEHQAMTICMLAETPKARAARKQVVEVFLAYKHGQLPPPEAARSHDPFQFAAERSGDMLEQLRNVAAIRNLVEMVATAPIWPSGKRPRWFNDLEVREFLTVTHRQMQMHQVEALGRERFGNRCPGKSTVGEFWLRLDKLVGLPAPTPRKKRQVNK